MLSSKRDETDGRWAFVRRGLAALADAKDQFFPVMQSQPQIPFSTVRHYQPDIATIIVPVALDTGGRTRSASASPPEQIRFRILKVIPNEVRDYRLYLSKTFSGNPQKLNEP